MAMFNSCILSGVKETGNFHASRGKLENMTQMHLHSVNRRRESASAYHMAGCTQMRSGSLRRTTCHKRSLMLIACVHFCKKCNHDKFCPGFKVSEDFMNLLLCFYASGGCILARMPICVSFISQGHKRKIKNCLPWFRL